MTPTSGSVSSADERISSSFDADTSWYAVSMLGGGAVILQYVPEERQTYSATERDDAIGEKRVQFLLSQEVPVLRTVEDEETWEAQMLTRATRGR